MKRVSVILIAIVIPLSTCGMNGVSLTGGRINVTGGGASAITAIFTAGRSTTACAHPCAVVFEATGTTDTDATIAPFHELRYTWDFGDSRGETWTRDGRDKNTELGPIAAHVFECPSADTSGTVTLTVSRDGTTSDTETMAWDCDAPSTQWATTDTKCVSDTADVSWCPASSTTVASQADFDTILSTYVAADRRIVLRCGGAYTSNGTFTLNVGGPGYIGGNDCGTNRPVVTRTANNNMIQTGGGGANPAMDDWRIANLRFVDDTAGRLTALIAQENGGRIRNLTLHDLVMDDCGMCIEELGSVNAFYQASGQTVSKGFIISEVAITRNLTPNAAAYPITFHGDYGAIIGTTITTPNDNTGTHNIRTGWVKHFVIAHSESKFAKIGVDFRPALTLRCAYDGWGDCQYVSIVSNYFHSTGSAWMVEIGGDSGDGHDGQWIDTVAYDNFVKTGTTSAGSLAGFLVYGSNTTLAHNVVSGNSINESYAVACSTNAWNTPTGTRSYFNTLYDIHTNNNGASATFLCSETGTEAVGNFAAYVSTDDADGIICVSCSPNANNLADRDGTFPFVTLPPVVEADFELSAGVSPAHSPVVLDTVTTANYWEVDHAGVACSGNCDAGAYERE